MKPVESSVQTNGLHQTFFFSCSSLSLIPPSSTVLSLWSPLPLQFSPSLLMRANAQLTYSIKAVECHNTLLLCICIVWCEVVKVYSKSLTALANSKQEDLPPIRCWDFVFWTTGCHSSRNVLNFARLFRGTPKVSTSVTKQSNNINYIKTIH